MKQRIPRFDEFVNEIKMVGNINAFNAARVLNKQGSILAYISDTPNSLALFIQETPNAYEIQLKIPYYHKGLPYKTIRKDDKDVWQELEKRYLSNDQKKSLRKNFQYINESVNNVQSIYKSLRNVKNVKDKWFLYYLTKEYMDMGYYDKSDEKKFKKAFDDVIEWFNGNANMQRIAKENDLETSYDMILSYKKDKED